MRTHLRTIFSVIAILIFAAGISACGARQSANPAQAAASDAGPTPVVVRLLNLDAVLTVTATPVPAATDTPVPSPTATQGPASLAEAAPPTDAASPTPACTNQAELVAHLSISPNTALKAGEFFAKIWRVKNIGTCIWDQTYSLVFADGERMEAPESTPLSAPVNPGETVDLQLTMMSPILPLSYTGNWLLQDGHENRFGIGPDYGQPLQIVIVVQPPPAATSG